MAGMGPDPQLALQVDPVARGEVVRRRRSVHDRVDVRRRDPGHLERPPASPRAPARRRSRLPAPSGARWIPVRVPDPLVAGVHQLREVVVGDHPVGHGEAGAEETAARHQDVPGHRGRGMISRRRRPRDMQHDTIPDPGQPGERASVRPHPAPGLPHHAERGEPQRPAGVGTEAVPLEDLRPRNPALVQPGPGSGRRGGRLELASERDRAPDSRPCWSRPSRGCRSRRRRTGRCAGRARSPLSRRAPGELVRLGARRSRSRSHRARGHQRVQPLPVVVLVLRERGDRAGSIGGVASRQTVQRGPPSPGCTDRDRIGSVSPSRTMCARHALTSSAAAERSRHPPASSRARSCCGR